MAVDGIRKQISGPLFSDVRAMFRAQAERAARRIDEGEWRIPESLEERQTESMLQAENILPLRELLLEMRGTFSGLSDRERRELAKQLGVDEDELADFVESNNLEQIMEGGFNTALRRLDADVPFDPTDPDVIEAQQRLNRQAVGIARTTQRSINDEIRAGITESEGVGQMRDRIRGVLKSMSQEEKEATPRGVPGDRARRIASTTTTTTFEKGQQKAFKKTGMAGGMWLTQRDIHVRRGHIEADGQVKATGEPFMVRGRLNRSKEELRHPGDPEGRASNIINCRCTVLPIPDTATFEEMQEQEGPALGNLPQIA